MASDSLPNYETALGRNFALFINFSESEEQEKVKHSFLESVLTAGLTPLILEKQKRLDD
ncbi:MAG: hypothetical protein ACRENG_23600 [bacterium]